MYNFNANKRLLCAVKISIFITLAFSAVAKAEVNLPVPDKLDTDVTTELTKTVNENDTYKINHNGSANQTFNNTWKSFDVPENNYVDFHFSNNGQISVNKITGANSSQIFGHINQSGAGGTVYLINPSGVLFGRHSSVNLNSFSVSTYNLKVQDDVNKQFTFSGQSNGQIVNHGNINIKEGGFATFLAPVIENTGTINAPKGTVALVSNKNVTFNMNDGQQISLELDKSTINNISTDNNKAQIENSGVIKSDGGKVFIKAEKANELISKVINTDGIIEANSVKLVNGKIAFGNIDIDGGNGATTIAGSINANGANGGNITVNSKEVTVNSQINTVGDTEKGGNIKLLGDNIKLLSGTNIDASGYTGGGNVLIGGDTHGGSGVKTAASTFVGKDVNLKANAINSGDGGKVVVWADDITRYFGNIYAKGGILSGNGGFAEVSGKNRLSFDGTADLSAPKGNVGSILLDPLNIVISDGAVGADNAQIADNQILQADGAGSTYTISETSLEALAANAAVNLQATNNITLNNLTDNLLYMKQTNLGSLTIKADSDGDGVGTFTMDATDKIRTEGGNITISGAILNIGNLDTRGNAGTLGGSISLIGNGQVNTYASALLNTGTGITINGQTGTVNIGTGTSFQSNSGTTNITTAGNGAHITLANVTTNRNLSVNSNSGGNRLSDIILNGTISTTNSLDFTAGRDIIHNGNISGTNVNLYAGYSGLGGTINLNASKSLVGTSSLYMYTKNAMTVPDNMSFGTSANVYIYSYNNGSHITLGALNMSGSLTVNSNAGGGLLSDVIINGNVTSAGTLDFTAGRDIIQNGNISGLNTNLYGGYSNLGGSITLNAAKSLVGTSSLYMYTKNALTVPDNMSFGTSANVYMYSYNDGSHITLGALNMSGSLTVSSNVGGNWLSDVLINGNVTSANSLNITAGRDIIQNGNISGLNTNLYGGYSNLGGTISLNGTKSLIGTSSLYTYTKGAMTIPDNMNFGTSANIYMYSNKDGAHITFGALNLTKPLTVNTNSGGNWLSDIILNGNITSTNTLDFTAGRDIIHNGNISTSSSLALTAGTSALGGTLSLNAAKSLSGTSSITLKSKGAYSIPDNFNFGTSNSITLQSNANGAHITLGAMNLTKPLSVTTNTSGSWLSDVIINGDITSTSSIDITAGRDLIHNANISTSTTLALYGGYSTLGGSISLNAAKSLSGSTSTTLISKGSYSIPDNFNFGSSNNIYIYSNANGAHITLGNLAVTKPITVNTTNGGTYASDLTLNGNLTSTGAAITLEAGRTLVINGAMPSTTSGAALTMTTRDTLNIPSGAFSNSNESVNIYSRANGAHITLGDEHFVQPVTINTNFGGTYASDLILNGSLTGNSAVTLEAGKTLAINAVMPQAGAASTLTMTTRDVLNIPSGADFGSSIVNIYSSKSGAHITLGDVAFSKAVTINTNYSGTYASDLTLNGSLTSASGAITLEAGRTLAINGAMPLTASTLTMTTRDALTIPSGSIFGAGAVNIYSSKAGAHITLGDINFNNTANINTNYGGTYASDLILNGNLTSTGNITLEAGRTLSINSLVPRAGTNYTLSMITRDALSIASGANFGNSTVNIYSSANAANITLGDLSLTKPLNVNANYSGTWASNVVLNGNITSTSSISITSGNPGGIVLNGPVPVAGSGQNLTLYTYAPITIPDNSNFGNAIVNIKSTIDGAHITLGTLNLTNSFTASTRPTGVNYSSDVIVNGNITSTGLIDIEAGRTLTLNAAVPVAGTNLTLWTNSALSIPTNSIFGNATVSIITGTSGAHVTLGDLSLNHPFTVNTKASGLTYASNVILNGNITSSSSIDLTAGGTLALNANVPQAGNNSTLNLYTNSALSIPANSDFGNATVTITSGANGANITLGDLNLTKPFTVNTKASGLTYASNVTLNGNLTSTSTIDLTAGGTLALNANVPKAATSVSLYTNSALSIPSNSDFGNGNVSIVSGASGAHVTLGTLNLNGSLTVNTASGGTNYLSDIYVNGNTTSASSISLTAGRNIYYNANTTQTSTSNYGASTSTGLITVNGGTAPVTDSFRISAGGTLTLSKILDASNSIESVELDGTNISSLGVNTSGSVIYNDTNGNLGGINQAFIDLYGTGDLTIKSAGTLTMTGTINSTRNLYLRGTDIIPGAFTVNTSGAITLDDTSGNLSITQAYLNTYGTGSISVKSAGILSLGGNINSTRNITLTGTDVTQGVYTLTTTGSVALSDTLGNLTINQAYADAFSGTGTAVISSAGSIILGSNINTAKNVSLTATDFTQGSYALTTAGDVTLNDTLGNLSINQAYIDAFGSGNIAINSAGVISLSGNINTSRAMTLGSNGFDTTNSYYLNHGAAALTLNDSTSDITAILKGTGNINASGKNITLTALDGALNINNVTANAGTATISMIDGDTTSGNININTINANNVLIQNNKSSTNSNIVINNGGSITSSDIGKSIVLSTPNGNIINNANGSALNATNGNWALYTSTLANTLTNGLIYNKIYNRTYASNAPATLPTGNYILYGAEHPTLTITVADKTKVYGDANPTLTYSSSGYIDGDNLASSLTSAPVLYTNATTTSYVNDYVIGVSNSLSSPLGYDIAINNGNLSISAKSLTVKANNKHITYGDTNPTLDASYTGLIATDNMSEFGLTYNLTGNPVNAGTYNNAIVPSALSGAKSINYNITYQNGDFVIDQKALTVKANNANKTYGDANPAFNSTFTGLASSDNTSDFGLTYNLTGNPVNAGTYNNAIVPSALSGAKSINYNITYQNGDFVIDQKALTVKANDTNKTYGDANPAFTASYTGFISGEDQTVLGGTIGYSTAATNTSSVNSYAITPSGLTSSNYNIAFTDGTLTVSPKGLTVKANNANKTYGDANPTFNSTFTGLASSDNTSHFGLTYNLTGNPVNAGTYNNAIVPSALSGAKSGNYTVTYQNGDFVIDQKALTVKANNNNKTYGDANPAFNSTFTGLASSDNTSDFGLTYNLTGNPVNAGTYSNAIVPSALSGAKSINYNITYQNGDFVIDQKALTVKANNANKTYGDANPAFNSTFTGLASSDNTSDFGLTYNLTGNPVNAGTYNNVIVPSALSGAKSINYNITYQNGNFVIDQKALTVKANDTNKTYGDANPAFNSTFTGLASSDSTSDFGLTYNLTGNPVNAGTYNNAIVPSALSGAKSINYNITYQNGDFVIDQKALTVKANNANKTYGDANPAFNSTFTGLASSDNSSDFGLTYNLTGNPVNAGTYNNAIVPSALSGAKSINYNITYQNGDFVIDQKALTVKANNANKTYGDANPAFNSTFTGLASSDNTSDFGLTYNLTGNPVNAGTYNNAIIPSALSGAKSINYSITYQNGDFVIDQKALTVKANNTNKTYGDANPAFTASYTGFISGEDQTVLGGAIGYTTAATNTSSVNNYAISPSGLTSLNYNIAFTNGTLTVLPKGLTVKANNANKTYGDANPQFSATYEGFITGQDKSVLGGSLSFSTSANNYSPAGNYTVTPLGLTSTNYTIEFTNGNLVINPKIVPTVVIADIIDPIIPIKKDIANDIQFRKYDYATLDEISNNIKYSNNEIPTIKNISNQMQIENKDTVNQPIFNDTKNNKKFTWE